MNHCQTILRSLEIVLICLGVLVIGFVLMIFLIQNRLVFPGGGNANRCTTDSIPCPGTPDNFLVPLETRSGHSTIMWVRRPNNENSALTTQDTRSADATHIDGPVLLFFYGNGACLAWCDHLTQRLSAMGITAAVVEYVGYGASNGRPSERLCYESADAAYDYFVGKAGVSPDKIIAVGHSLGAAVACDLAHRKPIGKLVMLSGFTTLADAAAIHFPWLPVRTLLCSRFDSSSKIPRVQADILFIHGEKDGVVPVEMSRENFELAQLRSSESTKEVQHNSNQKKNSQLVLFPDANHNLMEEIPDKVYGELEKFVVFSKKDDSSPLKKNGNRVN